MIPKFAAAASALLGGLAALSAAGCGSTCVASGHRIVADVVAGANLNDSQGSGPQHVKYRVWALKDPASFELVAAQRESAVGLTDAQQDAARIASGFGQPLFGGGANPGWITPGTTQTLTPTQVTIDEQFTAIGIVVLYPQPGFSVVRLDCAKRPGYEAKDGTHKVSFRLDGTTVQPGP